MSTPDVKKQLFEQFARIGTAISSPARLELLELLAQAERSVDSLAKLTGLTVANSSQHLQALKRAGLIAARKQGQFVFYRLAGIEVTQLLEALQSVGEAHLAEVDRLVRSFVDARDTLEPVDAAELAARARKGMVTVLDVRPAEEFAAGHLPGAVNVPIVELRKRLKEFAKGKEVIAYCRGPYCLMSIEAVELLRAKGFKARRLDGGLPQWRLAGLQVEI